MKKVLLMVLFVLSACSNNIAPATGTISGTVLGLDTTLPLANVQVRVGTSSSTTTTNGSFEFANVPVTEQAVVKFEAIGYMAAFRNVTVVQNQTSTTQVVLTKVAVSTTFAANLSTIVSLPSSSAQVVLSANSLVDATTGVLASGSITAQVTPIDPAANPQSMPGDYTTQNGSQIESFGALSIEFKDSNGNKLNLGVGKTATIRIPVATRATNLPATIPLFYFNETTGRWLEEGSATLLGTPVNAYYEGTVSHFSYWNADQIYNTIYVNGCLVNSANLPVTGGFTVSSQGFNYSGTSSRYANTNTFRIPIKKNAIATLLAVKGTIQTRESNLLQVGPASADLTLATCLVLSDVITNKKATILSEPRSQTVLVGSPSSFSVTVSSDSPVSYQWYRNAILLPNATSSTYLLNTTILSDNGAVLTVVVSNLGGSLTSFAATLTVLATPGAIPIITAQPTSLSKPVGQSATFGVSSNSPTAVSFQWYKNGVLIVGATNSSYTTAAVSSADNGAQFSVVITNLAGSVTSTAGILTVTAALDPFISQQPSSQAGFIGMPITFSVTASGTNPISYQWFRNSVLITGATNSSYAISSTGVADFGVLFYVVVSNSVGTVTSASVQIISPPMMP